MTLPDKTVNVREENPFVSNPAVCKGHPQIVTFSIADLYNVHLEFNSRPSYTKCGVKCDLGYLVKISCSLYILKTLVHIQEK